jgi:hypothetical protein
MGGGGSRPREIEQENKIVYGMPINNRGLVNIPPEKFQNNSLDSNESIEYNFISYFNFKYAIYIILIISFFFIVFLVFISCNHKSFKKK